MQSSSEIITSNKQTPNFSQAGCPSCRPTNSVKALKGKISHSMDLLTPSSPGGLPTLSLTTNSSWLPGAGLPCLSSALLMSMSMSTVDLYSASPRPPLMRYKCATDASRLPPENPHRLKRQNCSG